jgi:catalase
MSRRVAILLAPGYEAAQAATVRQGLEDGGAHAEVISTALGVVKAADGSPMAVDKTSQVAASVLYDAVYVPGGAEHVQALLAQDEVVHFVSEALKHGKALGFTGEGVQMLAEVVGHNGRRNGDAATPAGVVTAESGANMTGFLKQFTAAIAQHRFPEREGSRGGAGNSRSRPRVT